jgi:hypothetical protein
MKLLSAMALWRNNEVDGVAVVFSQTTMTDAARVVIELHLKEAIADWEGEPDKEKLYSEYFEFLRLLGRRKGSPGIDENAVIVLGIIFVLERAGQIIPDEYNGCVLKYQDVES